jgi:hypothetical protein
MPFQGGRNFENLQFRTFVAREIAFPAFNDGDFLTFGAKRRSPVRNRQNVKSPTTTGVSWGISRGGVWGAAEKC